MDLILSSNNVVTVADSQRLSFFSRSSVHSYNGKCPSDRTIRVTNGRLYRNGKIELGDLWISKGKILDAETYFYSKVHCKDIVADEIIDACGMIVSPGFIDIQLNGGFGYDFSDPNVTMEQVNHVTRNLSSTGCTAICPTIITSHPDTYKKLLPMFVPREGSIKNGAALLGVHTEGPFISRDRAGAHPVEYIQSPVKGKQSVEECYGDVKNVTLVTIAPELEGSNEAIEYFCSQGITVSMGHTTAHVDEAIRGVDSGAKLITHLFNAMTPFHHRDPGMIGILGMPTSSSPFYSIIVDGIHSHPYSVKFAHKAMGSKCVLITDSMAAMGLPDGHYKLGKQKVIVANNKAVLEENADTLAGAIVTIDECVRNYRDFTSCTIEEALRCVTVNPATVLNIHNRKGLLQPNMDADFVFLDDNLNVHATFIGGELVWHREGLTLYNGFF